MATKKNVAVILSGCGVYDGAEIHESVLTLLAIAKAGAKYQVFAPDMNQHHVINHLTGEAVDEKRNVLVETARIARGNVKPLSEYRVADFDAMILPGGFGAAKNLSSFAFDGANCSINKELEAAILATNKARKPIGALCIAPVIIAKILEGANITIGSDAGTISAVEAMGANHELSTHGEVVIDSKLRLATTPCYMLDANIMQIAEGADNVVTAVLRLI